MNTYLARFVGRYRTAREHVIGSVCRGLVNLSTIQARAHLRGTTPLRILVDTSVLGHSITHETAWISTGTKKWGPHDIATGYAARIPVHSPKNDSRLYQEVRYLAGIAQLARRGHIELFTSAELKAETFRQPVGRFSGYGYYDLGLFRGIPMESVDGFHLDLNDPKQTQLRRVASCNDPLYQSLLALFGQKGSLDAFHVFTAEKFGMFCFLHIDFPLSEKVTQNRAKAAFTELTTKILTPSQLGKMIGLLPVDSNLLSYEEASFPVRPDLHWDKQRRAGPKK